MAKLQPAVYCHRRRSEFGVRPSTINGDPFGERRLAEIFRVERPEEAMGFTGERFTSAMAGQIEIEHLHRYFLVREMARGKDVLDIACGEGYGAAIIAQVARSVVGMDVSAEAVSHAERSYPRPNLTFRPADARHIAAPDASFDVVSSFETLEHFYEHEEFYAEIRRVLRPGGILVISTPDRAVYSPDGSVANRYHVRELSRSEFETGLTAVFPHVAMLLQRPMIGSLMLAAEPYAAEGRGLTFEKRGPEMFESNEGLPRALYLVAVASDAPVRTTIASAYIETSQLAVREAEINQKMLEMEAQILAANYSIRLITEDRDRVESVLKHMTFSRSWRLTAPLRAMLRKLRPTADQAPQVASRVAITARPEPERPRMKSAKSATEQLRQRQALGTDLPPPALSVAVGVVTYDTAADTLSRCWASIDLARTCGAVVGQTYVIDNGQPSADWPGNKKLCSQGNIGFGQGHNALMREAFASGADVYVATNPDGAFHPKALERLVRVVAAHDGRALVEACQFPAEHPKEYDAVTLETAWASGACLAIPKAVFEETNGFDDVFFMYCEDVDLSWRARAAGMKVLIAPSALFLHPVTNRTNGEAMWKMMLESAVILGQKWGNAEFAEKAAANLAELGARVPDVQPEPVPERWRNIPDFSRGFSFAAVRW